MFRNPSYGRTLGHCLAASAAIDAGTAFCYKPNLDEPGSEARTNLLICHGVLAPRARWRRCVVAYGRVVPEPTASAATLAAGPDGTRVKPNPDIASLGESVFPRDSIKTAEITDPCFICFCPGNWNLNTCGGPSLSRQNRKLRDRDRMNGCVQEVPELLTGLEQRDFLRGHVDSGPDLWVPSGPRTMLTHLEASEPA